MLTKVHLVKAMVFPVVVYGYESWAIKKAHCQRIDAFELWCWRRLSRVPWIKPVIPKGNQSWIFFGRIDAEAEALNLWPPDAKNWLIWKDPDAGKDWKREDKGMTEDEMVGWHHWLDGHEWCNLWELVMSREAWPAAVHGLSLHCKQSDMTEQLNWTELENTEWKSWGITPHLLGLLKSLYMTISTAGGGGARSLPHCWWDVWTATL